jgi:3-deoxy-manno-octulosonate cytidylyltransferase (CMP-KDO synthetase)
MKKDVIAVIPARFGSKRLPGKPLIPIHGRFLILHVLDRAREIKNIDRIIVATDDDRVVKAVEKEGAEAMLTPSELPSGSDRVAWVAKNINCRIIVNIQGDEPLIDTACIENAVQTLSNDNILDIVTLGFPLRKKAVWMDPNVVKVITDENNFALYFTRQAIPFFRDSSFRPLPGLYHHLGVYLYRYQTLLDIQKWEISPFESVERLEQLRFLYKGLKVKVIETSFPPCGVDVLDDVSRVEKMLKEGN